ncbi:MAG: formylglycine-generating enzyme family protein, partial [Candidatus Omnitrophica bacterium]|nr:formylglycine-generating enzyme family protein [Candidatus Omnitrophota bacterium]
KFGGVFAFGGAREEPDSPMPPFSGSPYFYPAQLAVSLEVFGGDETDFGQETDFEMVPVPTGSFLMGHSSEARTFPSCEPTGCDYELPQHEVTLANNILVGRYEITNLQFANILNWAKATGKIPEYSGGDVILNGRLLIDLEDEPDSDIQYEAETFSVKMRNGEDQSDHPVVEVSWFGAVAFCNWASERSGISPSCYDLSTWQLVNPHSGGYRLPSEAEWEYVCRGVPTNPHRYDTFSFGDDLSIDLSDCLFRDSDLFDAHMVWCGNHEGWSSKVGTKLPNGYGIYDLHGNVIEWCQDWWHNDYTNAPTDGSAWESPATGVRVKRGGFWGDYPGTSRSANRTGDEPEATHHHTGFRIVQTAK